LRNTTGGTRYAVPPCAGFTCDDTAPLLVEPAARFHPTVMANTLGRHVPELVLFLLIVVLTFIIVDLDRPRRSLIRVSQSSLIDLGMAIDSAQSAGDLGLVPEDAPRPAVTGRR